MVKVKFSVWDSRGMAVIDCSECNRGGNGADPDKCSSGHRTTTGHHGSCFSGELIDGLEMIDFEGDRS